MTLPLLEPLAVPTLRTHAVPEPFVFGHADRVKFHELDVLDHVNNARYLSWFETLRIAYLRAYGISDYSDAEGRPVLVLKSVSVDFKAPLHLEEVYVVAGRTRAYRNRSWTMEYVVTSGGRICATSQAVICLMENDFVTRKALPERYVSAFRDRDGAVFEG